MWLACILCGALFCRDADIIIILPFITIPSLNATSSLKDQYGHIPFMISALVDGYSCTGQWLHI